MPDEIRRVYLNFVNGTGSTERVTTNWMPYPQFRAFRDAVGPTTPLGLFTRPDSAMLLNGNTRIPVRTSRVNSDYFSILGVRAAAGRLFDRGEDDIAVPAPVAVISDAFWRRAFDGDRSIIGKEVTLGPRRFTIVGIAPPKFTGLDVTVADMWLPANTFQATSGLQGIPWYESFGSSFTVIARAVSSADEERLVKLATESIRPVRIRGWVYDPAIRVEFRAHRRRGRSRHSSNRGRGRDAHRWRGADGAADRRSEHLESLSIAGDAAQARHRGPSRARRQPRTTHRTTHCRKFAARRARCRRRVVVRLVRDAHTQATDTAQRALGVRSRRRPHHAVRARGSRDIGRHRRPHAREFTLSGRISPSRSKSGQRGTYRRSKLRSSLLALQAALCVVLLVGSGLFIRSLDNVRSIDVGYDIENQLFLWPTFDDMPAHRREVGVAIPQVAQRLATVDGVEAVAYASVNPMQGSSYRELFLPGRDSVPSRPEFGPSITAVSRESFTPQVFVSERAGLSTSAITRARNAL